MKNSYASPSRPSSHKGKQLNGIKQLKELYIQQQKQRHPNVPEYAIPQPKFTDSTANGLTKCIITYIELMNGQAERINCMGRTIDQRQTKYDTIGNAQIIGSIKYIPTTMTRGTADISATVKGRSVKIEVKTGQDKQRQAQREYQKHIEDAGGIYFIAQTFDQFYTWYNETF